ncbi:MAG TPA: membrane protein insertase YidC, partial [Chitinophagaceae bacterium]|nr:membrane protein insertase YidC [Chitinophagaceae bacterium]
MKFDRNTIIGFVILAALFFGYFFYTNKEQSKYRKQKAIEDSIALSKLPKPDTALLHKDSMNAVVVNQEVKAGDFKTAVSDSERIVYAGNDLLRIAFTTKGGQPKWVELKNFKGPDSQFVKLAASDFDKIGYTINTGGGNSASTTDLNFQQVDSVKNADKSTTVSFTLLASDTSGSRITHRYTIRQDNYMIDFDIEMKGANHLLEQGLVNLNWQYSAGQQESDVSFEKSNTQVGYVMDGDFDYHSIGRKSGKEFSKSVKWLGVRQRFFFTALVAKSNFTSGKINWEIPPDSEKKILKSTAAMKLQATAGTTTTIPLSIYYGPSDFHTLKKYNLSFEKLINLGQGMYSFVRPINRYLIMPVFDLMKK